MKRILALTLILLCATTFADPVVSDVVAKQRYPWNGMVDIDYTITGDATDMTLEVSVEDVQNNKVYTPTKFLSLLPVSEGRHRITWSTEAEGITIVSTNVLVTLSIVKNAGAKALYYVVDLSGGPNAENYPVTTLSAPPNTEWPDEYKATKLVLRQIEPGDIPTRNARITKPFYVGVFEVTQHQYELIMGSNPVYAWSGYRGDNRPVCYVSYDMIRGSSFGAGWPESSAVDATSILGKLRAKTGLDFDLPTEAQWEYACRAGTTSAYNNGGDTEADLRTLGRYSGNNNDGRGGYSGVTVVGSYAPNAWGLYDMHGNVWEWCLDWYGALTGDDPVGASSGSRRVVRGGSYYRGAGNCTSSYRSYYTPSSYYFNNDMYDLIGFRLVCSAGL